MIRFQDFLGNDNFGTVKSNDYKIVSSFLSKEVNGFKIKFLKSFFPTHKLVQEKIVTLKELFKICIIYDFENSTKAFLDNNIVMELVYDRKEFGELLILNSKNKLPTSLDFFNRYKSVPHINFNNRVIKIDYSNKTQVFNYKKLCKEDIMVTPQRPRDLDLEIHVFAIIPVINKKYCKTRFRNENIEALTSIMTEALSAKNFAIFQSLVSDRFVWDNLSDSVKQLPIKRYLEDDVAFDPEIIFTLLKVLDISTIEEKDIIEIFKKVIIDEHYEEYKENISLIEHIPLLKEKIEQSIKEIDLDSIRDEVKPIFLDFILPFNVKKAEKKKVIKI